MTILFVTSSDDKLGEVRRIVGGSVDMYDTELVEPQAVDLGAVITAKTMEAYNKVRTPLIVEDSGLFIDAWNGLPGALVKWFLQCVDVEGICTMLHGFPRRDAIARTLIGFYDGKLRVFEGAVAGRIADSPRGSEGFGFDSIFIPNGSNKTFAEMDPDEKDQFSMRRRALEHLISDEEVRKVFR